MFDARQYYDVQPYFEKNKSNEEISLLTDIPPNEVAIHRNRFNDQQGFDKRQKQRAKECRNYLNNLKK
ncbi:MAG: hypothetical protein HQ521_13515 [Bacteroidetes bacterium]|nr:hypothetical protein [Bacteroidota bacterium]